MLREQYCDAEWRAVTRGTSLETFDGVWNMNAPLIGAVNRARGGWSCAARLRLSGPDGGAFDCVMKRQANFVARTWRHPWHGVPTLVRELTSLTRAQRSGLGAAEPLYCAWRRHGDELQAILVVRTLAGFHSLWAPREPDTALAPDRAVPAMALPDRWALIRAAGRAVQRCHAAGMRHNCLYPRHILVRRRSDGACEVRFLDLEKARWRLPEAIARGRDLDSLLRRSYGFSSSDRMRFYLAYRGEVRLSPRSRRLLYRLLRRARRHGKALPW